MRILVVSNNYPYPIEHGVNLRLAPFARYLSKLHEVTLLCYNDARTEKNDTIFHNVKIFSPPKPSQKATWYSVLSEKFSMDSLTPKSDEVRKYISDALDKNEYDLIFAYEPMITSIPEQLNVPLVVDAIDSGVLQYWREFRFSKGLRKKVSMLKWLCLSYLFDKKYFSRANTVIYVADEDLHFFKMTCRNTPSLVIQNGVDHEFFSPQKNLEIPNEIVFEGSLSHPPNVDGAIYFVRNILPIIRSQIPDIHFTIVGRSPPREIEELASEYITVTGFVDDIRPYLDKAAVFVCPLRRGGGIKNKVLQAWSMGKAVVATTASIGGLAVNEGENILVRDGNEAFASAVIKLLGQPETRKILGEHARKTIMENYTWDRKSTDLENVMKTLANKTL